MTSSSTEILIDKFHLSAGGILMDEKKKRVCLIEKASTDGVMEKIVSDLGSRKLLVTQGGPIDGVVIAGSAAYTQGHYKYLEALRDVDIVLTVQNKEDLAVLFGKRLHDLKSALCLTVDECPPSVFQQVVGAGADSAYWNMFDAVRYGGYVSEGGQKRSIKVIDLPFLLKALNSETSLVRVLSYRRVSVLHTCLGVGKPIMTVGSIDDEHFIPGHNGLSIHILTQFMLMKVSQSQIGIGVFTDMLLSGVNCFDYSTSLEKCKHQAIRTIMKVIPSEDVWIHLLFRYSNMPLEYKLKLLQQFQLQDKVFSRDIHTSKHKHIKWCVTIIVPPEQENLRPATNSFHLLESHQKDLECLRFFGKQQKVEYKLHYIQHTIFPSAHSHGIASLSLSETTGQQPFPRLCPIYFFFKETDNVISERRGLHEANKFFKNVQPLVLCDEDNKLCFYIQIHGKTLAEIRLKLLCDRWSNDKRLGLPHPLEYDRGSRARNDLKYLSEMELVRAKEMMACYRCSISKKVESGIHKVFHERLENDRLMRNYENQVFNLLDIKRNEEKQLAFEDVINLPLIINGTYYKCLNFYCEYAKNALSPALLEEDLSNYGLMNCFGLGDSHCGNVMLMDITDPRNSNNKKDIHVYIDYEYAGYHSPFLDLAKSFFIDVFFNAFLMDICVSSGKERFCYDLKTFIVTGDNESLHIEHKFSIDWISHFASQVKLSGILKPLLTLLRKEEQIHRALDIFRCGMFCTALFGRRFPSQDQLFLVVAIAVQVMESSGCGFEDVLQHEM